ncbi:MAG: glycerophosphodiester phosphodiesterase [bacterium]
MFLILAIAEFRGMAHAAEKVIIAHRGASGYVPEHTLEGVAMSHAFGVNYIEQDLVLTKDRVPVVLHDIELEPMTDVAIKFPGRCRADGKYYAIDFTLAEIKQLNLHERKNLKTGEQAFPGRFPMMLGQFRIPTLEEELQLIQGLNKSRGKNIGIYPEIKSPSFHRAEGADLSAIAIKILAQYGYKSKSDNCIMQCFEWPELKEIRKLGYSGRLVYLVGGKTTRLDGEEKVPFNLETMKQIAKVADGVGPAYSLVIDEDTAGNWKRTGFVSLAHQAGLVVHPYTLRADVPVGKVKDISQMFELIFTEGQADGVFTDHPDAGVRWRQSH